LGVRRTIGLLASGQVLSDEGLQLPSSELRTGTGLPLLSNGIYASEKKYAGHHGNRAFHSLAL
jgi:hypothetical protein